MLTIKLNFPFVDLPVILNLANKFLMVLLLIDQTTVFCCSPLLLLALHHQGGEECLRDTASHHHNVWIYSHQSLVVNHRLILHMHYVVQ